MGVLRAVSTHVLTDLVSDSLNLDEEVGAKQLFASLRKRANWRQEGLTVASALVILRFLQQLCEGHNKETQNYVGATMLRAMGGVLAEAARVVHPPAVDVVVRALDALTEALQGPCVQNQVGGGCFG